MAIKYERPAKITTLWKAYEFTCQCSPKWSNGSNHAQNQLTNIRHFHDAEGSDQIKIKVINQPWARAVLEQYVEDRADKGLETSNNTLNKHLTTLRHVLRTISQEGYLNACPVFKMWEENAYRTNYFEKEHVEQLAQYALERDDIPMAHVIRCAGYTGLRQGELMRLKVRDVDLKKGFIHVGGTADTKTKGRNYRTVSIHKSIVSILEMRTQGRERTGYVFDEFPSRKQLYRRFLKCRDRLIYENQDLIDKSYVFHTLRHSYGTWHIQGGTSLTRVRDLMGHCSVTVTERYLHNTPQDLLSVANNI